MKSLFFTIFLSGISALAANPEFQIISGQVQLNHGGPYANGTISIDYSANQATLSINPNYCPPQHACTLSMRPTFIQTLPIESVTVGECNIKTVVAKKDERPVDGILQKLTIMDFSENTCPTFSEIIGTAQYLTSGNYRLEHKEVEETSNFDTKLIYAKPLSAVLLEKSTFVGFAPPEYTGRFALQIMKDGKIQYLNNRDEIKVVAQLSTKDLTRVKKLIASLGPVKLVRPKDGQGCMDAPSRAIIAHQSTKDIPLWNEENCQVSKTDNKDAKALILLINKIETKYPSR